MNAILIIVPVIGEGGHLMMVFCVVPTADELASQRLEMVPVLGASHDRRSKHVFGDIQLKVTDE